MANPNTLGKYLRERRFLEGLTMIELTEQTGVTQSEIHCIEVGKKFCPTIRTIERLSAFYGVPALELAEMIDLPNIKIQVYIRSLKGDSTHEIVGK